MRIFFIFQDIRFENGEIFYRSKYLKTRNFLANSAAEKIVYPEVGTFPPDNEDLFYDELGNPIEDENEIKNIRCRNMLDHFPTDNTDVSILPIHGWLMTMTVRLNFLAF